VNSIIDSAIPVNVHEWDRDSIMAHDQMRHTKFMHRIPSSITHLRVVEIEGVDLCPCAGTHVSNTGNIPGISFVGKKNKGKGRLRISYSLNNL
jgi:misacylated tRNA(Ala) deacylase